jgi:chromosome segregation ATPase
MALKMADVVRTAEEIHKRGEIPTQEAVRKALGGGSYSTIGAGLREWREKQGQRLTGTAKGFALDLGKIINIEAIMAAARTHAQAEFAAEREAYRENIEALERELAAANSKLDDAGELVTLFKTEMEAAKMRAAESDKHAAVLQARVEYLQEYERDVSKRLSVMMEQRTEAVIALKAGEENRKRLEGQLTAEMDKNEALAEKLAAVDRKLAASEEAVKLLKEQLVELKADKKISGKVSLK